MIIEGLGIVWQLNLQENSRLGIHWDLLFFQVYSQCCTWYQLAAWLDVSSMNISTWKTGCRSGKKRFADIPSWVPAGKYLVGFRTAKAQMWPGLSVPSSYSNTCPSSWWVFSPEHGSGPAKHLLFGRCFTEECAAYLLMELCRLACGNLASKRHIFKTFIKLLHNLGKIL